MVVAHIILGYFISSGLLTRMVDVALPKAVIVNFVETPHEKLPPYCAQGRARGPAAAAAPAPGAGPGGTGRTCKPIPSRSNRPLPPVAKVASVPAPVATEPTATSGGEPKTVTSGVEYIRTPQFVYPEMSRRMGEQGRVVLRVLVNEKGQPEKVQVQTSSGFARLDEASRQAGLRAQFKPYMEDGHPIAVYVLLPFSYSSS
ncbi:energy transducer TonB [Massilia sp. B-10]|nr:energy transducer TonB [Massilia sp. B-10]